MPRFDVREVPRGRPDADDADEVGRRDDGDRPDVQGVAAEGAARPGDRAASASGCDRERPLGHRRTSRRARRSSHKLATPNAERIWYVRYAFKAGMTRRGHPSSGRRSTRGSCTHIRELVDVEDELRGRGPLGRGDARAAAGGEAARLRRTGSSRTCGTPRERGAPRAARSWASRPCSSRSTPAPPSSRRTRRTTTRRTKRRSAVGVRSQRVERRRTR